MKVRDLINEMVIDTCNHLQAFGFDLPEIKTYDANVFQMAVHDARILPVISAITLNYTTIRSQTNPGYKIDYDEIL